MKVKNQGKPLLFNDLLILFVVKLLTNDHYATTSNA